MSKPNLLKKIAFAGIAFLAVGISTQAQTPPSKKEVLDAMRLTNNYFMQKWPDPGKEITTNKTRPSNIWTRGVYYEGLMALYQLDKDKKYYDYAVDFGEKHQWGMRSGNATRNADDQTCGQTYIDLYRIDPKPERIKNIKASIDSMLKTDKINDWTWVDALQMAMPVYAKLGVQYKNNAYFERMYQMYNHTKTAEGGGLYNTKEHFWWRDKDFVPPYKEPNGANCYWSRGNGWVFAALVRVMDIMPKTEAHRAEYLKTFKEMAAALVPLQRTDGFWNVSLMDPTHFGGKDTTGTALFVYGMAWGINNGVLDAKTYRPVLLKAWNAMVKDAVHPDGMLGFVQGTGKEPKDSQPVSYTNIPDFEDYGLGCFLLAGSEVYQLKK
jgi:unsaturated rhamnogalacturonyl hydrolase